VNFNIRQIGVWIYLSLAGNPIGSKLPHMSASPVFSYCLVIPESVIDENGHVNNVAYVQWMQDAATVHHPEAAGYKRIGNTTWYASEHHVHYLLPAFSGEEIEVRTWISEIKRVRVHRRYEFVRKFDGKVIARGETEWVHVDAKTGSPIAIPANLPDIFPVLPDPI